MLTEEFKNKYKRIASESIQGYDIPDDFDWDMLEKRIEWENKVYESIDWENVDEEETDKE